jgi:predicted MPP superfamily phosphohydrolase
MADFTLASWLAYLGVVLVTWRERGRNFAVFVGIMLGLLTLTAVATQRPLQQFAGYGREYLMAAMFAHFLLLAWPTLRPLPVRLVINYPAAFFVAGTMLAWPALIALACGASPYWLLLPYALSALGLLQSLYTPEITRDLVLDGADAGTLRRYPLGKVGAGPALSVVQITDPHLGTFMSIERLRRICQRAVERNPDLICLTGDFLTIESNHTLDALTHALSPLSAAKGKVFACFGNHDHEAPHAVRRGLLSNGVRLHHEHACEVDTPIGRVQLLGFDFHFRDRDERMRQTCARFPKPEGALRIVLLHDPGAFNRLPQGEGDLVLSGHTHGGHVGLLTFGLPWTAVSAFTRIPDHGLWARGKDRLYVHRGTGHYGFPVRIGVSAEQSLLRVQRA